MVPLELIGTLELIGICFLALAGFTAVSGVAFWVGSLAEAGEMINVCVINVIFNALIPLYSRARTIYIHIDTWNCIRLAFIAGRCPTCLTRRNK